MRNLLNRHLSYANVAATVALVVSMSGGAFAATHYLINSTKQINPGVLRTLKGQRGKSGITGPRGPAGAQGNEGTQGVRGPEGPPGKEREPAPSTEVYEVSLSPSTAELAAEATRTLTLTGVPPGAYAISAKGIVAPVEEAQGSAECVLAAESDSDHSVVSLGGPAGKPSVTLTEELTHTFAATAPVTLTCKVSGNAWMLEEGTRIVAIKADRQHKSVASAS